jgi:hypothetical protein
VKTAHWRAVFTRPKRYRRAHAQHLFRQWSAR